MSELTNDQAYRVAQLNEAFAALSDIPDDHKRYALARLHGRIEGMIKGNEKHVGINFDELAKVIKEVATNTY